jgi:ribosome-binding factor A
MSQDEKKIGYRRERLERLAAEVLEFDLLPSLNDPLLEDLHILHVEVLGHLSGFHVTLVSGDKAVAAPVEQVQERLRRAQHFLRSELAGCLRIKRMPTLRLTYIPLRLERTKGGAE